MRRQLIVGAVAVTATIVIAFVVPLGLAVRVLAANRPLNAAEQAAQSVATVVALTGDAQVAAEAVAAAETRADAVLTVFLRDGDVLGEPAPRDANVERAFSGAAFAADGDGARLVFVPATRADGTVAVVRAAVSDAVLNQGVRQSWLVLLALAVAMLGFAVLIADWLGRTVVRPVGDLAMTAQRLGAGDLSARATPAGPPEVAAVGGALNTLAGRITQLLAAEREHVADLSHRLRTPLTALRLDAEAIADPQDRQRLRGDVDALEATVTELIRDAREPSTQPPPEPIDLVPIVRERAAYWGALADDQQRRWALRIDDDVVPIALRQREAEALLDVLIDNVFSHSDEGTPYTVCVSTGVLAVEDEGAGFGDVRLAARGSSARGSTGLGLDIARQVAGRLGGTLRIADRDGGGARVALHFPAGAHEAGADRPSDGAVPHRP